MPVTTIKLNSRAIGRILKEDMRPLVDDAATRIADHANTAGITVGDIDGGASEYELPVTVRPYTTDRAAAAVSLAHPAGIAVEAKHGLLRKAAASVGLEVRS